MVQPMLSVCQSGLKVSFTLKNMQTDGVKMEKQRFASGCAARPWLMSSIPWVHPAPPPWPWQSIPFTRAPADYPQQKLWYADSLIWLVAGIKTMQCTNAGLYQGADKTRGIEEQAAGKGLAKGRHPPQGQHRKVEGKNSHICTFLLVLCWMMSWGAVGAISIPGDKARLGTPATQWVLLCRLHRDSHSSSPRSRTQTNSLACSALIIFLPIAFAFAKLSEKLVNQKVGKDDCASICCFHDINNRCSKGHCHGGVMGGMRTNSNYGTWQAPSSPER